VLVYLTKGFREQLTMRIEEETLAEEGTPVAHVKHGPE
jgi:putrescine importer